MNLVGRAKLYITYGLAVLILHFGQSNGLTAIQTSKKCYEFGEDIVVSFTNDSKNRDFWVGIFPSSQSDSFLNRFLSWIWSCGSQTCGFGSKANTVTLSKNIRNGSYKAVLTRSLNAPFFPNAISESFVVQASCSNIAASALASAREELKPIIAANIELPAQLLQLIFHDCIGGCDGKFKSMPKSVQCRIILFLIALYVVLFRLC